MDRHPTTLIARGITQGMIDHAVIDRATDYLKKGEVVALPTETVYGLCADIENDQAVKKIFTIKARPAQHPLIVHLAQTSLIDHFADINDSLMQERVTKLVHHFFPGPLTLILPRKKNRAVIASGGAPTIALRVSKHPIFQSVVSNFRGIAAPSANPFGGISPISADHVNRDLYGKIPFIVDGGICDNGLESTIINLTASTPMIVRPGPISHEAIATALGEPLVAHQPQDISTLAPGNLERHYAPNKPFFATPKEAVITYLSNPNHPKIALIAPEDWLHELPSAIRPALLIPTANSATAYGRNLYQYLRSADEADLTAIWIVLPDNLHQSQWSAVRDRLYKALSSPIDFP